VFFACFLHGLSSQNIPFDAVDISLSFPKYEPKKKEKKVATLVKNNC